MNDINDNNEINENVEFTEIRKAACAGTWYPKAPAELATTIAGYFFGISTITGMSIDSNSLLSRTVGSR